MIPSEHLEEGTLRVSKRTSGLGSSGGMHVAPLSRALRSAVGLVRIGGELVAMPHRTAKTGYKAPNAYGARSVFTGDTTYNDFNKKVLMVGDRTGTKNKKLMPYYPWASRNRPSTTQQNIVGRRYGTHPSSQEKYKGSSTINLSSGGIHGQMKWKTTNQVFNECAMSRGSVGLANQGIASDVARTMHQKQGIYG